MGPPTFTDVAWDAPYAEAVAWAEQNGYLGGYGNGFFGPEDMMTVAFSITNKLLVPDGKILPQSPISVKALRYAIGQIGMAD